jgi:hypothetical protein
LPERLRGEGVCFARKVERGVDPTVTERLSERYCYTGCISGTVATHLGLLVGGILLVTTSLNLDRLCPKGTY